MASEFILICNEHEKRRISIADILYVNTNDYLSTFFLKNGPSFSCTKPLNEISAILPEYFFQINRSCTVNLNEIVSVKSRSRTILLCNLHELIVSTRRLKSLYAALAE